jgi:hypothetical protein
MKEREAKRAIKEYVCECSACRELCELVPCMGTPKEITAIIANGYAQSNELVVSTNNDPSLDFTVVKPRGDHPTDPTQGTCVFYKEGKCILHDAGLKPIEGRVAIHDKNNPRLLYHHLKRAWDTKLGRELINSTSSKNVHTPNE